ncbi:MAG: nicotinamide riboside transporter PnuC [Candidatus Limisoma sp.]
MMILELLSTILGLIQGVLVMLDKRSNWIFYSLQMLFLVLFSISMHLWGDVVINSIYFFVGIGGFFLWKKKNRAGSISVYDWKWRVGWGIVTLIAIAVFWVLLSKTNNPLPFLDSITSVTSIVATWFMFCHKLEAWVALGLKNH